MKRVMMLAVVVLMFAGNASAQCVPWFGSWPVRFFETWEGAVAFLVETRGVNGTMAVVPIASTTKTGFAVTGEFNGGMWCRPSPSPIPEPSTPGWKRHLAADPSAAQAFAASLPPGTPVGMVTIEDGYRSGSDPIADTGRMRVAPSSHTVGPRVVVVIYYEP